MMEFFLGFVVGALFAGIAGLKGVDNAYRRTREVCEKEANARIAEIEKEIDGSRGGLR